MFSNYSKGRVKNYFSFFSLALGKIYSLEPLYFGRQSNCTNARYFYFLIIQNLQFMKQQVLKLTAKQVIEGETFAMDFYAEVDRKNRSLVIGSLLCDLFRFMAKQKKFKLKGYKVNEITDIKLQIGNLSIDTAKIDKMKESSFASMLRQQRLKLKLRHAATAKKLFAELVWDIVEDMTREATKMTFEELLAQLDTEAAQEKDEKIERQIVKQFEELMSAN